MNEKLMNTRTACAYVEKSVGIKINRVTVYYWMTKGRVTPCGDVAKLKFVSKLGRKYTTEVWINDFLRRL
jgi:hypothetical protein